MFSKVIPSLIAVACTWSLSELTGQEQEERTVAVSIADGNLVMQAPASWEKVDPRFNMIEAEFSIEKVDDDENNGRMTIMGAGGSIQQNIDRWIAQFSQPDGGDSSDVAEVEEMEVDGMKVHTVDISGTFADRAGPRAPATYRDNYRMLAAIIETDGNGNYFIKLYGGEKTIDENADKFMEMIKSLKSGGGN